MQSVRKNGARTLTLLSLLLQPPEEVSAYVTPGWAGKREHLAVGEGKVTQLDERMLRGWDPLSDSVPL